jgi:homoserine dehydrogenase
VGEIKIGLLGLGAIGGGVVEVLRDNADEMERRIGKRLVLAKAVDLDTSRAEALGLDAEIFSTDAADVIDNPDIDIVIELIGGYEPARTFVLRALEAGKHVVTANKALLAVHGEELAAKAVEVGKVLQYEASVGGAIPIIRSVREAFASERIGAIYGIMNGTTNYILSEMTEKGGEYEQVLVEAQEKKYAEADPTFDVEGIDAAHKLALLVNIAFGTPVDFKELFVQGITDISPVDIRFAEQFGYRIKLLAIARLEDGKVDARVHPTMIPSGHMLAQVSESFNAIYIVGNAIGHSMLYGRGAGPRPTAGAVLADCVEIARDDRQLPIFSYQPENRKRLQLKPVDDYRGKYFLRFTVKDEPGVLAKLAGKLGEKDISISAMHQDPERLDNNGACVVILTYEANEGDIKSALAEIDALDVCQAATKIIRIEEKLDI